VRFLNFHIPAFRVMVVSGADLEWCTGASAPPQH